MQQRLYTNLDVGANTERLRTGTRTWIETGH
jgi:hypothetical protein